MQARSFEGGIFYWFTYVTDTRTSNTRTMEPVLGTMKHAAVTAVISLQTGSKSSSRALVRKAQVWLKWHWTHQYTPLEQIVGKLLVPTQVIETSSGTSFSSGVSPSAIHIRAGRGHTLLYKLMATASMGLTFPSNVALK